MKRNRNGSKHRRQMIQVWTFEQAQRALPYVATIMRSLREYRLEAQQQRLTASRLGGRPGRPDRATLLARDEAIRAAQQAEDRFRESLEELHTLDIYCLDPINGRALIPFTYGNQLAWFICEIFESDPIRFWRLHKDPLDKRRPLSEIQSRPQGTWVV